MLRLCPLNYLHSLSGNCNTISRIKGNDNGNWQCFIQEFFLGEGGVRNLRYTCITYSRNLVYIMYLLKIKFKENLGELTPGGGISPPPSHPSV